MPISDHNYVDQVLAVLENFLSWHNMQYSYSTAEEQTDPHKLQHWKKPAMKYPSSMAQTVTLNQRNIVLTKWLFLSQMNPVLNSS